MKVMFPGSFDPIHLGHVDIINQAANLFGEVIVAVMHNPEKSYLYKILKNNAHLKIMNDCEYNQQMV